MTMLICLSAANCKSQLIHYTPNDSGNGHWYEAVRVPESITWTAANDAAQARGGYLATVTTSTENQWVFDNLAGDPTRWIVDSFGFHAGPYIDGYQDSSSPTFSEPAGGWTWVTGETWGYTSWAPGQPNDVGEQDFLHYWTGNASIPQSTLQDIGDDASDNRPISFIIEYDTNPTCTADTNSDGLVDAADFTYWLFSYNSRAPQCDQNSDGTCTPADFSAWIANFNAGCN